MADSSSSSAESARQELANVQLNDVEAESTASTTTSVGSLNSSMSETPALQETSESGEEAAAPQGEAVASSSSAQTESRPVDGVVTRAMLEGYLQKLLKNIPLTTEETKYLCDRVR